MATPKFNSKSPTIKRILREAAELSSSPSADYHASPASDSNLFEWHFTLRGPPSSAFSTGIYHGRIVLPPTYPLRPPSFRFLTPSGRFQTNQEICLSISGHHEESWQPAWGIRTALVALRAFMETDAKGQIGGLDTSRAERERRAGESVSWACSVCGRSNEDILKEAAAGVLEGEESSKEEVPKELVMGMKKDLERKQAQDEKNDAELAEGFVRTVPTPVQESPVERYPPARPGQGVPQPTGVRGRNVEVVRREPLTTQARTSPDGIPIWIDRTIALLVVLVILMVIKIVFGL